MVRLVFTILLLSLAIFLYPVQIANQPIHQTSQTSPATGFFSYDGIAPESISFPLDKDTLIGTGDVLQTSTTGPNGPWTNMQLVKATGDIYVSGLLPGVTYWWRLMNSEGFSKLGVAKITQPSAPSITGVSTAPSSVTLSWTNNAHYGGAVTFVSYIILNFTGNIVTTILSNQTTTYTITGLPRTTSQNPSFNVVVTEKCGSCSTSHETMTSSIVIFVPVEPDYTPSLTVDRFNVDIGHNTLFKFTCGPNPTTDPSTVNSHDLDFGDGSLSVHDAVISHMYAKIGNYTASCSISVMVNDSLNEAMATLTVHVNPDPAIEQPKTLMVIVDAGQSATFITQAKGGTIPLSYAWNGLPTGCESHNTTSLTCNSLPVGTFDVSVTVKDSLNNLGKSDQLHFIVNPDLAIVGLTASKNNFNKGDSTTLNLTVKNGTAPYQVSYTGLPPGCNSSNSTMLTCTPSTPGNYNVQAHVTDQTGYEMTSTTLVLTVSPSTTPPNDRTGDATLTGIGNMNYLAIAVLLGLVVAVIIVGLLVVKRIGVVGIFGLSKRRP
jgi:hypothetical protein